MHRSSTENTLNLRAEPTTPTLSSGEPQVNTPTLPAHTSKSGDE